MWLHQRRVSWSKLSQMRMKWSFRPLLSLVIAPVLWKTVGPNISRPLAHRKWLHRPRAQRTIPLSPRRSRHLSITCTIHISTSPRVRTAPISICEWAKNVWTPPRYTQHFAWGGEASQNDNDQKTGMSELLTNPSSIHLDPASRTLQNLDNIKHLAIRYDHPSSH